MALDKQEKTYVYGGAALTGAYLFYRFYQSRSGSNTSSTGAVPADAATTSDFAAQQGQEQSDVAALQQDIAGLTATVTGNQAQEQSDSQALQSGLQTVSVTEAGDVSSLSAANKSLAADLEQGLQSLASSIAAIVTPGTAGGGAGSTSVAATGIGGPAMRSQTPWTSPGFFNLSLGQVVGQFKSPEATARYLFSHGFRPTAAGTAGPTIEGNEARAGGRGFNYGSGNVFAGTTWVYSGRGAGPLPRTSYTIGKSG